MACVICFYYCYINYRSTTMGGPFPAQFYAEKVERVGNAAIEGARQALISKEKRKDAEVIPKKTKHVRLEMEKNFQDQFVNGLLFDKYE